MCRSGLYISTFPNKRALSQAALKRHLAEVTEAVELVCKKQEGGPLRQMVTALITTFFEAKMRDAKASVALYSVSSDVDGARIVQQIGIRFNEAIVGVLKRSREPVVADPQLVASILQGMMVGVSRRMLESGAPEKEGDALRRELMVVACAYLDSCSARVSVQGEGASSDAGEELSSELRLGANDPSAAV